MRSAPLSILLAVLLAPAAGRPADVPEPIFWPSEDRFVAQLEEAQFLDRIELHLVQYSADARWRMDWAALRGSGAGIHGAFGSTTSRELHADWAVALNVFPAGRLQLRYDRRELQDGRFAVSDERLDGLWHSGRGFALGLSGWPAFEKERASIGLGARIGGPRSSSALELRVVEDRFLWNDKTDGDLRFARGPRRLLADGHLEAGRLRLRGSIDAGLEWTAEDRSTQGPSAGGTARGLRRMGDVEGELALGPWTAGARLTLARLERSQEGGSAVTARLDRSWGRALVLVRREAARWTASAHAGFASQRERFSSAAGEGAYRGDATLLGVEGGWKAAKGVTLRLGWAAAAQRASRTSSNLPLEDRRQRAVLDKAHVAATWEPAPRMAIELLLSQAIGGGAFGGGSAKFLLAY